MLRTCPVATKPHNHPLFRSTPLLFGNTRCPARESSLRAFWPNPLHSFMTAAQPNPSRTPQSGQPNPSAANPLEQLHRQRSVMLRFVRMAFFVLITVVAMLLTLQSQTADTTPGAVALDWWVPISIAIMLICSALIVDLATPNKKLATISAIFFGLIAGLLATAMLSAIMDLLIAAWVQNPNAIAGPVAMVKVMLGIALCYLGVSSVLQTQDDFRLVIPYVEFSKQLRGVRPNVLDTSALIDARIVELCASGLLQSPMIVPSFVVAELQLLADNSDKTKRARGRRGLDVITRLQRLGTVEVILDETVLTARAVDRMLVELAEQLSARILTTDHGLARIAQIEGVQAINLHDVAAVLKPTLIPGDKLTLRLLKHGEQAEQAVGYLDDGTMVVVENAAHQVGQDVAITVGSAMQTSAGRLIFARLDQPETSPDDHTSEVAATTEDDPDAPDASPDAADTAAQHEPTPAPITAASSSPPVANPANPKPGPLGPKALAGRRNPSARNPRR